MIEIQEMTAADVADIAALGRLCACILFHLKPP
mgnify:CR=1 FL=1